MSKSFLRHFECIGHLRSYVRKAVLGNEALLLPILKGITELYRIERRANKKLRLTHEQRGMYRHGLAKPNLEAHPDGVLGPAAQAQIVCQSHGAALEAVTYANAKGEDAIWLVSSTPDAVFGRPFTVTDALWTCRCRPDESAEEHGSMTATIDERRHTSRRIGQPRYHCT